MFLIAPVSPMIYTPLTLRCLVVVVFGVYACGLGLRLYVYYNRSICFIVFITYV